MRHVHQKLAIARGEKPAELLFKNTRLVNVLSGEIHPADVAVEDGRVIGFGNYEAKTVIDLKGAYLAPSLIDGHFHVESSLLTAPEFARAVVPHGTGAVVIDPHEYANVLGLDGIRYVLESTKNLAVDFFIMLPSCVPATHLETAGARLTADDLKLMSHDERIAIFEIVVWRVPANKDYPNGIKYRAWLSESGKTIFGFDNHKPKGPHLHIGSTEVGYVFRGLDSLREDIAAMIRKAGFIYED